MKIYIAGKITDCTDYKELFSRAEMELRLAGHTVLSPAILPDGFDWGDFMHICKAMIDCCEAVFLLQNWQNSRGARQEMEYATNARKKILYEEVKRGY